ncbi:MAG: ATP-dependent Clp protease ATP-binding subunit [Flavobacteriales bacterium]|nr:ATP-dependent Clp protease ATP-binding subunit [Flavobacteriales bacterium]
MATSEIQLTDAVREILSFSENIAREYAHASYASPHLLRAALRRETGMVSLLDNLGKDVGYMREWADVRIENYPKSPAPTSQVIPDKVVDVVLREADFVRLKMGLEEVTPECLLAAVCTPGVAFSFEQMRSFPLTRDDLMSLSDEGDKTSDSQDKSTAVKLNGKSDQSKGDDSLAQFCIDKTERARQGKIDPIVGRDREVKMIAEILGRRSKPNVIVVGDPGVGKTALIEGLALDIINEKVPKHLAGSVLLELDLGALIAGASYKGEVEDRIKKVISRIKIGDKTILFIDEIHALLDQNRGLSGVVNLLKPELARGEITLVGATTNDEFREFLEPEEAFMRRFETVRVEEPGDHVCRQMLEVVVPFYETHHDLTMDKDAAAESIRLARRYLKDRRLPDSAIDLVDRTMAAIKMMNDTSVSDIQALREKLERLESEVTYEIDEIKYFLYEFENRISPILLAMLSEEEDPSSFTERDEILDYIRRGIATLDKEATSAKNTIGKEDIAAIVAYKTGIPMGKVQSKEKERLLNMEETAALLYGAPPGYVGYKEGGLLVNKIRQQPYSIVLFDEIEKAHPSVFDLFLQILDEGKLHDRLGKEGDFTNAVVLFTSNIGSAHIIEEFANDRIPPSNELLEIMAAHFRPEFLARLTEIIPFRPISEDTVEFIFDIQLKHLLKSLEKMHIEVEFDADAKTKLAMDGFTPKYGARPLNGVIRNELRRPISRMIISEELNRGDHLHIALNDNKIEFNITKNEPHEST